MAKIALPKEVETYLDNSVIFNKFGLIYLASVKFMTKCEIDDKKLKKLIIDRFASEMSDGTIEFIEKNQK